ncbi:MAG TPA: integrin alpha, partial [Isosphaeraceae bacterium]|nr:integrin alpha [Isosphaeraceae bacterium]
MLFGNRRPRTVDAQRRNDGAWAYRPLGEGLEDRLLLAIDLGSTSPPSNPIIATAPFGMDFGSATANQSAGISVADLGDLNGDGYEDFAIGASGGTSGTNSEVYVVFGSRSANTTAITDWIAKNAAGTAFQYTANNRVGDLGQLGLTSQTNPITGTAGGTLTFPFAGITFTAPTNPLARLGASVAGFRMANGLSGLIIGAPGGYDINNANAGTGRVYVITGNFTQYLNQTVDLDTPAAYPGLDIVTYATSNTGATLGAAVAGGFNILGDGNGDIIMGAPAGSIGSATATGVVYLLSAAALPSSTPNNPINVATLQTSNSAVVFAGINSGDSAGFSIADAGSVNQNSGTRVDDLLIGAPGVGASAGAAYLVYGGSGLPGLATSVTVNGTTSRYISLANVRGGGGNNSVPGAVFSGISAGSMSGYSVASAGSFSNNGIADILIGSPGYSSSTTLTSQGAVSMLFGALNGSSAALTGLIPLASVPSNILAVNFIGGTAGEQAGYSVSQVGVINAGQPNPILIGAPGFNSNAGTAYLIPGQSGLRGTYSLANEQTAPLNGL